MNTRSLSPASTTAPARAGSVDYVSGRTRLYGIVGHPISQARSPQTVTFELRRRGIDAVLVPLDVAPDVFDEVMPQLMKLGNLDGLVVTVPHKMRVVPHLTRIGPLAKLCGGVSILARCSGGEWIGEMFDGMGCVAAIERRGVLVAGLSAQVLGAGGAGAAIAIELARHAVSAVRLVDPQRDRARALEAAIAAAFPNVSVSVGPSRLDDIDLLINATPIGMLNPAAKPIPNDRIPPRVTVLDAVMDPDQTLLLKLAEESGCLAIRGREMLDSQIVGACDFLLATRERDVAAATADW
jgi:shikimate dehydrogenase